jgi:DNA-directed RNA polymerase subunit beta'
MIKDFKALKLTIASPQQILSWSYGEVKKAETINYRTHRPEVDGLMDEKIFGPTKNFECYCGKYKKIRYKGIICDKCGVEVTHKRVRRERMGHIKLASPVTHVWYAHGVPNKLAIILGITQKKLETVIYFARYLVTKVDAEKKTVVLTAIKDKKESDLKVVHDELNDKLAEVEKTYAEAAAVAKKEEKNENKLNFKIDKIGNDLRKEIAKVKSVYTQKETNLANKYKDIITLADTLAETSTLSEDDVALLREFEADFFEAEMGAEAIEKVLNKIDLDTLLAQLEKESDDTKSLPKKRKIMQRIRVLEGMKQAGLSPSWIIMEVLPVIPPDLRPIIQLPGGRFATSDLNDLYRRVINRNNRLKRLINLGAPEIILRNEKRMLQEAVDALIDNDHRPGNPVLNSRGLPYKSLSDMLRGKQGRFRQNLLGKRVDYSGRSVIVTGPELQINQCGLPKTMALELFKPFVLRQIIVEGLAPNIKSGKLFFESRAPEVWDLLEKVIQGRPVLLNRAPTLHKQGIQAFFPVLIEGNAIQLHPMVCRGFNADFDGDQMAVHLPLSEKAIEEAKQKMFARSNILLMADGNPVINVEKDMALGVFHVTGLEAKEHPKFYASATDAMCRYQMEDLGLREEIRVLIDGKLMNTTIGRIIFNQALPEEVKEGFLNKQYNKGDVAKLSSLIFNKYGPDITISFLNKIEALGFKYATDSALTLGMEDFIISPNKDKFLEDIEKKEDQLTNDYYNGLITEEERKRLFEKLWMDLIEKIAEDTWNHYKAVPDNNLVTLQDSGAVPVQNPLRQISGVRGLILDPSGNIVQLPLRSNYKQGLSALEYFVAARGTRKGLADTALKTAESGYLTRRLCDVAQDLITKMEDCGTKEGIEVFRKQNRRIAFVDRITGRITAAKVVDPKTGEVLLATQSEITPEVAKVIDAAGVDVVKVRSVLTCTATHGVCEKCYGYNLGTKKLVERGMAVGIIAAQSMGEAATQLTLNTKHLSGRAGTDITQGLPRVEELFEARTPKSKSIIAGIDGEVTLVKDDTDTVIGIKLVNNETVQKKFTLEAKDVCKILKTKAVKEGDVIYTKASGDPVKAIGPGKVIRKENELLVTMERVVEEEYEITPNKDTLSVEQHAHVIKGTPLTEGSIDPKELMDKTQIHSAQTYLIDNIQETYGIQGIAIDDKHVEVIVRQMSRFCKVSESGDSQYLPGNFIDKIVLDEESANLKAKGLQPLKYDRQLVGITIAAIRTESFLSASSFEQQVRVLSDAAITGKVDNLRGLKENVIIGRTVPLGDEVR